jgi:hypothetical protein
MRCIRRRFTSDTGHICLGTVILGGTGPAVAVQHLLNHRCDRAFGVGSQLSLLNSPTSVSGHGADGEMG